MEQRRDILKRKVALLRRVNPEGRPAVSLRAMILYHSLLARYSAVREWSAFPLLRFLEFFAENEGTGITAKGPSRTIIHNTYNTFSNIAEYVLNLYINPISRRAATSAVPGDGAVSRLGRVVDAARRGAEGRPARALPLSEELRYPDPGSPESTGNPEGSSDNFVMESRFEAPQATLQRTSPRARTVERERAESTSTGVDSPRMENTITRARESEVPARAASVPRTIRVPSADSLEAPNALSPGGAPMQFIQRSAHPTTGQVEHQVENREYRPEAPRPAGIHSGDRNLRIAEQFYRKHTGRISRPEYASVLSDTSNRVISRNSLNRAGSSRGMPGQTFVSQTENEADSLSPMQFIPGRGKVADATPGPGPEGEQPLVYPAVGRDIPASRAVPEEVSAVGEPNVERITSNTVQEQASLKDQKSFVESTVKQVLRTMPVHEVDTFADKVFLNIERRMDLEMERRGY